MCTFTACSAVDDLGHPSVQHKPLAKGEHTQTSLAKAWDEPGMSPRVFAPDLNKPRYGLQTRDIEGNVVSACALRRAMPHDTW